MGSAKRWQPEDELIRDALAQLVLGFDGSEREVARRSGVNQSRLRTILAGTRAPASVGEAIRIAEAVGRQASDVIRTIEHTVADYRFAHPGQGGPVTIELTGPGGHPATGTGGFAPGDAPDGGATD